MKSSGNSARLKKAVGLDIRSVSRRNTIFSCRMKIIGKRSDRKIDFPAEFSAVRACKALRGACGHVPLFIKMPLFLAYSSQCKRLQEAKKRQKRHARVIAMPQNIGIFDGFSRFLCDFLGYRRRRQSVDRFFPTPVIPACTGMTILPGGHAAPGSIAFALKACYNARTFWGNSCCRTWQAFSPRF